MRFFSFIFLALFFISAKMFAASESVISKNLELDQWIESYAAHTPFEASVKGVTTLKNELQRNLQNLKNGQTFISLDQPLNDFPIPPLEDKGLYLYFLHIFEPKTCYESEQCSQQSDSLLREEKEKSITNATRKFFQSAEKDSLSIVLTKELQSWRYYLSYPKDKIFYVSTPKGNFYSCGEKTDYSLVSKTQTHTYSQNVHTTLMPLKMVFNGLRSYKWTLEGMPLFDDDIKQEEKEHMTPHRIIIGDLPYSKEITLFKKLPSATKLKKEGITTVRIGLEMFSFPRKYSPAEVLYILGIKKLAYLQGFKAQPLRFFKFEELVEALRTFNEHPPYTALMQKLERYRKAGIDIEIWGLDS